MAEEAPVLDRDEGILHRLGDLVEVADELAVLLLEIEQMLAIGGPDPGDPLRLEGLEGVDVGKVVAEQGVDEANSDGVKGNAGGGAQGYLPGCLQGHGSDFTS